MRLLNVLAVLAPLLPVCNANFDVYMTLWDYDAQILDWSVFQTDPDQRTAINTNSHPRSNDVSGGKTGIRCVGWCGFDDRPGGIEVLEMHFKNSPLLHWTIYKNRNYEMIGLDGKVYGRCIPFPGNSFNYWPIEGRRKFRCLTSFTAKDVNW